MKKPILIITILLILIVPVIIFIASRNFAVIQKSCLPNDNDFANAADSRNDLKIVKNQIVSAKNDRDYFALIKAYKKVMFLDNQENLLKYSDSIIHFATFTKDPATIGSAYLSKGIVFYKQKEMVKALNNYVLADKYISQTQNEYEKFKMKYVIAQTKYYLGFYDEALALLANCAAYFETENDQAYVSTLHLVALCHTKMHNYDLAEKQILEGLEECKYYQLYEMKIFFQQAQAINNFYLQKYSTALAQLNTLTIYFTKERDQTNLMLVNFYTAKSYWKIGQKKSALPFLLKVTAKLSTLEYIKPEFREAYEMLIEYYHEKSNAEQEMKYIKELLQFDKIITQKYRYLSNTMHKQYDTNKLKQSYEKSIKKSNQKTNLIFGALGCSTLIIVLLIYRNIYNRKKYLRKFQELMKVDEKAAIPSQHLSTDVDISDIKEEIIKTALHNLEKFEAENKFLEENMNLTRLAKILKTNIKYASRIILKHRGKKTVDYINDLKINHVIHILKHQPKYRLYTTTALGEEAGFGSTQNFTRAFKSRTQLTPMCFIRLLQESEIEREEN